MKTVSSIWNLRMRHALAIRSSRKSNSYPIILNNDMSLQYKMYPNDILLKAFLWAEYKRINKFSVIFAYVNCTREKIIWTFKSLKVQLENNPLLNITVKFLRHFIIIFVSIRALSVAWLSSTIALYCLLCNFQGSKCSTNLLSFEQTSPTKKWVQNKYLHEFFCWQNYFSKQFW